MNKKALKFASRRHLADTWGINCVLALGFVFGAVYYGEDFKVLFSLLVVAVVNLLIFKGNYQKFSIQDSHQSREQQKPRKEGGSE